MLDTITNIQPKESGGGGGETRESIVYNMSADMLKKLPPNYVPHEVSLGIFLGVIFFFFIALCNTHTRMHTHTKFEKVFLCIQVRARLVKMGALNPMNIFLRQEVDRMQRVISIVRVSLTDLKLAIDGTIIMSEVSLLCLVFFTFAMNKILLFFSL